MVKTVSRIILLIIVSAVIYRNEPIETFLSFISIMGIIFWFIPDFLEWTAGKIFGKNYNADGDLIIIKTDEGYITGLSFYEDKDLLYDENIIKLQVKIDNRVENTVYNGGEEK